LVSFPHLNWCKHLFSFVNSNLLMFTVWHRWRSSLWPASSPGTCAIIKIQIQS
jgi:hypothetical protein